MKTTCLIFRYAPSYRMPIYELLNKDLNVSFIFPSETKINLKMGDYSKLNNCSFTGKEKTFLKIFHYHSNLDKARLFSFENIIFAGNIRNLTSWYILLMCKFRKKNIKTFLWTHGYYGRENFLEQLIKRIFYSLPNYVLLYGNHAKELMINNKIAKAEKLKVINNSLDYVKQLEIRQQIKLSDIYNHHFNNNNKNIVFVGRLTKVKKLEMLIEAICLLNNKSLSVNITFIGKGEVKDELILLTQYYDLKEQVWFYGETYDEQELAELIYNADICVSPGAIGLTAMHSLVYGTPVITNDDFIHQGPEFEAIEEGVTGLFFKHDDVESLASAITQWLNNEFDRQFIRENCYKIIDEKYNPMFQLNLLKSLL